MAPHHLGIVYVRLGVVIVMLIAILLRQKNNFLVALNKLTVLLMLAPFLADFFTDHFINLTTSYTFFDLHSPG